MWWSSVVLCLSSSAVVYCTQSIPLLDLLSDGNIGQLTQMATRLTATAAEHTLATQMDALFVA